MKKILPVRIIARNRLMKSILTPCSLLMATNFLPLRHLPQSLTLYTSNQK